MLSRFDVSLGGVSLLETVPEVTIIDINHTPAQVQDEVLEKGYGSGVVHLKRKYVSAKVDITYDLSIYDPATRQSVTMAIQQWAINGGNLRTTERQGQYLKVRCTGVPSIGSALRWTNPLTMTFTADETPFWLNDEEDTITFTNGGNFYVGGCVDNAPVSAVIKASRGGTITFLSVACGDTEIKLIDLNVLPSSNVTIDYDKNGFLRIKGGGKDLMTTRSGSDELLAACGKTNAVSLQCNTSVTCTMTAKGRWL